MLQTKGNANEHGFRDWKTHLRLKGTLHAQNIAYVRGLMLVLALLYWFVCLCGLHWNQPRFHSRIACWGTPSFFNPRSISLSHTTHLPLLPGPPSWLGFTTNSNSSSPVPDPMLFVIAATGPRTYKLGNCKTLPGMGASLVRSTHVAQGYKVRRGQKRQKRSFFEKLGFLAVPPDLVPALATARAKARATAPPLALPPRPGGRVFPRLG